MANTGGARTRWINNNTIMVDGVCMLARETTETRKRVNTVCPSQLQRVQGQWLLKSGATVGCDPGLQPTAPCNRKMH